MVMKHPTKFGCKKISSSVDMVEMVIFNQMNSYSDPELEDIKPIFPHGTLAHNVASLYQVWLQKVQQLRRYHPDEHSLEFGDLDLDHNRAIQSFHKTIHFMMMYHQTKLSCKRISSSENILKSHTLIISSVTVTLILKTAKQSF